MLADYHVHSEYSYDSQTPIAAIVQSAVQCALNEVCICDHLEYYQETHIPDFAARERELQKLESSGVTIRSGTETTMMYDAENKQKLLKILQTTRLDFIIGSAHYVGFEDLYLPEYFALRDRSRSVRDYIEQIALLIPREDYFSVVGHFDYPQKCADFVGGPVRYSDAPDAFDEIFRFVSARGKGIELNTSPYRSSNVYDPDPAILRRYRELGGEIVTIGSDAHKPLFIGRHINAALDCLRGAGFSYVCTFDNLKPVFHKI